MSFQDNENMQELLSIFQVESEDILERIFDNLLLLEKSPTDKELSNILYRDLHSIKGAVRMVGFNNIQNIIHKIEDIFDAVKSSSITLNSEKISLITKALNIVSIYLQDSVKNQREIIGEDFSSILSSLEFICDVELNNTEVEPADMIATLASIAEGQMPDLAELSASISNNVQNNDKTITDDGSKYNQEEINKTFNECFETMDSIIPEEK